MSGLSPPLSGLPETKGVLAPICAAIPGALLSKGDVETAGRALTWVADVAGDKVVPISAKNSKSDASGNLWFIRAAHLYGEAGGDRALFEGRLLPLIKRIVTQFISPKGLGGVHMDDGGLLFSKPGAKLGGGVLGLPASAMLRINAMWYSAIESTGVDLKAVGDATGDHYERLAGRFRRSFAKTFWCDEHLSLCMPEARTLENHGELPEADQLLVTVLPASPIPRTKQRQILQRVRERAMGSLGVLVKHPKHGIVESVLHRAWLVMGTVLSADVRALAMPEAMALMGPLNGLAAQAAASGPASVAAYYKDNSPVSDEAADALATAELTATAALLKGP